MLTTEGEKQGGMGKGQSAMGNAQWAEGNGQWAIGNGQRARGGTLKRGCGYAICCMAITWLLSSCSTMKNTNYFQGIKNDTTLTQLVSKNFEPRIQKGDLLSITVSSLSPENTVLYNAPQNAEAGTTGFLVDSSGNIPFFKLGSVHAAGMTRRELKEELQKELVPYLAQTVVAVGFLNRHVTLIGGGISSQVMPIPNDNMTLLDALATAGDIGEKGKKEEVMVIRENGNSRVFKKLDLTNESVFYSPYFYLQPNDIIYVKPEQQKKQKIGATQIISYVTTAISLYLLIFTRFIK
jgi:polysaccharide export outer membrane protein